jgi:hypothetical protein
LQLAIRQATQESSRSGRIRWKIGAYDGINQSFWIPQISQLSKVVYTCSFKTPGALMGRFVAFTEMKQGLSWIRNVRIRVDAE